MQSCATVVDGVRGIKQFKTMSYIHKRTGKRISASEYSDSWDKSDYVREGKDTSVRDSAIIGGLTDSALLGGLIGGSIAGGIIGDLLDGDLFD